MKSKYTAIIFIVALGFFLRVLPLHQSYWLDEAINVRAARDRSVVDLITTYSLGDFHPPLYHLLLHYWIMFIGHHEVATRMLSVLFGLATIYWTYLAAKEIFGTKKIIFLGTKIEGALLPATLLAVSGLHIYYSGEARMYALAAMTTSMVMYYLLKLIKTDKYSLNPIHNLMIPLKMDRLSILYIGSLWLMLMSDYVPWLLLPVLVWLAPVVTIIGLLLTLPWWPYFVRQLSIGLGTAIEFPGWGQVVGGLSLKNIALIPIKFLIGRISIDDPLNYMLMVVPPLLVVGLVLLSALWRLKRKRKPHHFIPLIWLVVPIAVGILLSVRVSLLSYFRFTFILPAFYLLFVQGCLQLPRGLRSAVISLLLVINLTTSSVYIFNDQFHREDWRAFSAWIDTQSGVTRLTLIPNLAQSDPYLYYQSRVPIADSFDQQAELPDSIYLVRYVQEIFDPRDRLRIQVEDMGYTVVQRLNFNGVVVWHYQRGDQLFAYELNQ